MRERLVRGRARQPLGAVAFDLQMSRLKPYSQNSVFEIPRPKRSEEHPTMKPPELVAAQLANSSRRGDAILDLFAGSGSTLIAAEQLGRRSNGPTCDQGQGSAEVPDRRGLSGAGVFRRGSKGVGGRRAPGHSSDRLGGGRRGVAASPTGGGGGTGSTSCPRRRG
jgi:hypothetical protein